MLTERKEATTALLTTTGFRDVLEIQRANRPDLYTRPVTASGGAHFFRFSAISYHSVPAQGWR